MLVIVESPVAAHYRNYLPADTGWKHLWVMCVTSPSAEEILRLSGENVIIWGVNVTLTWSLYVVPDKKESCHSN